MSEQAELSPHEEVRIVGAARRLAMQAHAGQYRKWSGGKPYFSHVEAVATKVAWIPGATHEWIAAAYLHDVLEDTSVDPSEIAARCGNGVLLLVLELTNPSKGSRASRAERKRMDRDHYKTASLAARNIKMVDRAHNLRSMGDAPADFKQLYARESRELMAVLLTPDVNSTVASELLMAIQEVENATTPLGGEGNKP